MMDEDGWTGKKRMASSYSLNVDTLVGRDFLFC